MFELIASSTAPDDGAARDRLGPITAAALLGSFFSLLRRMNVPYHYVRFLAGIPGSRVEARDDLSCHLALDALRVTPHCDAGSSYGEDGAHTPNIMVSGTPPLSGRERASRRRERGEECLSS